MILEWTIGTRVKASLTIEISPLLMAWQARSTAMRLLEHAVSTFRLGPLKSKVQLILLANML
jgi:hypothetical protein